MIQAMKMTKYYFEINILNEQCSLDIAQAIQLSILFLELSLSEWFACNIKLSGCIP